jgi:hypothetical protein
MQGEKYWLIMEHSSGEPYYYMGYYEKGLPCFNMAIADAVHFASQDNALQIHKVLDAIVPCEILILENNTVKQVSNFHLGNMRN